MRSLLLRPAQAAMALVSDIINEPPLYLMIDSCVREHGVSTSGTLEAWYPDRYPP